MISNCQEPCQHLTPWISAYEERKILLSMPGSKQAFLADLNWRQNLVQLSLVSNLLCNHANPGTRLSSCLYLPGAGSPGVPAMILKGSLGLRIVAQRWSIEALGSQYQGEKKKKAVDSGKQTPIFLVRMKSSMRWTLFLTDSLITFIMAESNAWQETPEVGKVS